MSWKHPNKLSYQKIILYMLGGVSRVYLSCEVCGTTLGHLEDDRGLSIASSLEGSDHGGGGGDVDSWDGELVLLSAANH